MAKKPEKITFHKFNCPRETLFPNGKCDCGMDDFNRAYDLWEAYKKESELTQAEIINIIRRVNSDNKGLDIVGLEVYADAIISAREEKSGDESDE